jgi:hypothetical protein
MITEACASRATGTPILNRGLDATQSPPRRRARHPRPTVRAHPRRHGSRQPDGLPFLHRLVAAVPDSYLARPALPPHHAAASAEHDDAAQHDAASLDQPASAEHDSSVDDAGAASEHDRPAEHDVAGDNDDTNSRSDAQLAARWRPAPTRVDASFGRRVQRYVH